MSQNKDKFLMRVKQLEASKSLQKQLQKPVQEPVQEPVAVMSNDEVELDVYPVVLDDTSSASFGEKSESKPKTKRFRSKKNNS